MIYLDYAASTPLRPQAAEVLMQSSAADFANPSSAHRLGRNLHNRIETCREEFLNFLAAVPGDRLIFTASATESNNTVIQGLGLKPGDGIAVSLADHPSLTVPVDILRQKGILVSEILLKDGGTVDEETFLKSLHAGIKLVVLSQVNNQSGTINDVALLSREAKKVCPGLHFHVDAAQGFGKIPLEMKNSGIDSLSISSHKIGGPKGTAALFLRKEVTLSPLLYGGGHEGGMRASTQAASLIFSFTAAAREAMSSIETAKPHISRLQSIAQEALTNSIDTVDFPFAQHTSPYIMTFLLHGISSDIILRHLEQKDIIVSSSSACSSKDKGLNPVFTALHLPPQYHKFVLRVSFFFDTTEDEVQIFCRTLAEIYQDLKLYLFKK